MEGWTLALDIPAGVDGLEARLRGATTRRSPRRAAGSTSPRTPGCAPDLLPTMYPRLDEWRQVRARLDPDGTGCSPTSTDDST